MTRRAELAMALAAGLAVALTIAGMFTSALQTRGADAQHAAQQALAESAYLYVDFADDFQDPRYTALNWRPAAPEHATSPWRTLRRPGAEGFMRLRDQSGAALLAAQGRAFLAQNFTMYVDVRAADVASEAGLAWGYAGQLLWRAVIAGSEVRLMRSDAEGEREIARRALPPTRAGAWRLGVISGAGAFSVAIGDHYVAQVPWEHGSEPGPCGLWARGDVEFDNFALQARPRDPGTLALAKTDLAGNLNIYLAPADAAEGRFITERFGNNYFPTWSPDGSQVAFQTDEGEGNTGLWLAAAAGDNLSEIRAGAYDHPAWSPRGSFIACASIPAGGSARSDSAAGQRDIMLLSPDATTMVNLTNHPADDFYPAWSPDGRKIAFCSDRDGSLDIFVANADGSDPVNITRTPRVIESDPAWSPEGDRIAFVAADSPEGRRELWVMNHDGTGRTCVMRSPAADALGPCWSPDGEKIAYTEQRGDDYDVVIISADGSSLFRAFGSEQPEATPAWRPEPPSAEPQIALASVWGYPGRTVAVPVLGQRIRGLRSARIEVTWDPSRLTLAGIRRGEVTAEQTWSFDARTEPGVASVAVSSEEPGWRRYGALAELQFQIPASAQHDTYMEIAIRAARLEIAGVATPRVNLWAGGVQALAADHLEFAPVGERQVGGAMPRAFPVRLRAVDEKGETCAAFTGSVRLEAVEGASTLPRPGAVTPTPVGPFAAGEWSGSVAVSGAGEQVYLCAVHGESGARGQSSPFRLIPAGSINGDSEVDGADLERAADLAIGGFTPTEWQAQAADVNGDGAVTAADVALIARIAGGIGADSAAPARAGRVRLQVSAAPRQAASATLTIDDAASLGAILVVLTHPAGISATAARPGKLLGYGWKLRAKDARDRVSLIAYAQRGAGLAAASGALLEVEFSGGKPEDIALQRLDIADRAGRVLPVTIER